MGRAIHELGDRQWDIPALRKLLDSVQFDGQAFDDFVVEHDFPRVGHRRLVLNARRILGKTPGRTADSARHLPPMKPEAGEPVGV